jgi:hypothetical protein
MIAGVEAILGSSSGSASATAPSGAGVVSLDRIPSHAFLKLSIGDATKKLLDMVKSKLTLPQIMQSLEKGGLPPAKHSTVYAVLRRRESQVGDILRMGEEWGLTEWYPNNPNLRKRTPDKGSSKKGKKKAAKKKAARPTVAALAPNDDPSHSRELAMSKADALEEILKSYGGQSVHAKVLAVTLEQDYGKAANNRTVAAAMYQDPKKRFRNLGENTWELVEK